MSTASIELVQALDGGAAVCLHGCGCDDEEYLKCTKAWTDAVKDTPLRRCDHLKEYMVCLSDKYGCTCDITNGAKVENEIDTLITKSTCKDSVKNKCKE
eukprot:CAMPEP_0115622898 /NCGR_PEP_ID=MMETSP0272-20121206/26490_1 /TAXON_ID=71861 /ORGANISM="Scrippsiella trochoidea, Strain CCMP3099" /LENGTH=98 /DNA_ID=CAMNT_0003059085 /DNA_START=56 /DNA_END=353 /DNA_ORIENTATION=-